MKKHILFDLDGTVTDPGVGITKGIQYALRHFDINIENLSELEFFIGPPLEEAFMKQYGFTKEEARVAITKYREYYTDKGLYENEVYPHMEETLIKLKEAGKELYLATSKPRAFAESILDHFSLTKYFTFIGGSEFDGTRVHKPDVIRYVLEENNITNIDEAVMIGDRKFDILAAHDFKMDSIGVLYGYGGKEELTEAHATHLVADAQELLQLLLSL